MKNQQLCFEFYHQAKEIIVKKIRRVKKLFSQICLTLSPVKEPKIEQLNLDLIRIPDLSEGFVIVSLGGLTDIHGNFCAQGYHIGCKHTSALVYTSTPPYLMQIEKEEADFNLSSFYKMCIEKLKENYRNANSINKPKPYYNDEEIMFDDNGREAF